MMLVATQITVVIVILIGLYGILTCRRLIRICISLSVMDSGLILFLVSLGFVEGATAPILDPAYELYVDPVPQALALTAIVIAAGVNAVALMLSVLAYRHYGTTDVHEIWSRRE